MFENPEIALEDLPAVGEVAWRTLDERYARRLQLQSVIATAAVAACVLVLHLVPLPVDPRLFAAAWLLVLALGVSGVLWPLASVPRKGYAIRDKDVLYRSGVVWRSVTAVPFNRVQHVETTSTPLDRRFGQATLQLFTAGSSGGDLRIDGMPADVAEALRLFILEKAGASLEHG